VWWKIDGLTGGYDKIAGLLADLQGVHDLDQFRVVEPSAQSPAPGKVIFCLDSPDPLLGHGLQSLSRLSWKRGWKERMKGPAKNEKSRNHWDLF
jgi:hypothetical protein